MNKLMCVMELEPEVFGNSSVKNSFIADTDEEYLVFLDLSATNQQEVLSIIEEYNLLEQNDAVLFGENIPEGTADLYSMISCVDMRVYAFAFKRSVLIKTGCFNEMLSYGSNYEFLCRLADSCAIYCIPCQAEECVSNVDSLTIAYVLRKYMNCLKKVGALDSVFQNVSQFFINCNRIAEFNDQMAKMLENDSLFMKIASDTAPFLMLAGNDICSGVLKDFSYSLSHELVKMGQALVTSDGVCGPLVDYESAQNQIFKGIVGFQAPVLEKDFFRKIKGKKLQFWFDHPLYFDDLLRDLPDDYLILCQDAGYAQYIKEYYSTQNALQLPPAGKNEGKVIEEDRSYDIVFIGSFKAVQDDTYYDEFQRDFYKYMIQHPEETFECGLAQMLKERDIILTKEKFAEVMGSLADVCRNVVSYFRGCIIEKIISAGFQVHVYGDSWNGFQSEYKDNLIRHPEVSVKESLEILRHAKIGLNIMTWHKDGMTERIANIMLSGAVCLSDESAYLHKNFENNREIVLFGLKNLDKLPEKINSILRDEKYRNDISSRAYKKASEEHTWKMRAKQMLDLLKKY